MEGLGSKRAVLLALLVDAVISLLAYYAAFRLRFMFIPITPYNWVPFIHLLPAFVGVNLVVHALFGVYQPHVSPEESQATVISSSFGGMVANMAVIYFVGLVAVPRSVPLIAAILQGIGLVLAHKWLTGSFQVPAIETYEIDEIDPDHFAKDVRRGEVRLNPDPMLVLVSAAKFVRGPGYHFQLAMPSVGLGPGQRLVKRAMDLGLVLIVSPLALLVAAIIAVVVAIDSGRPIFYSQARVGRLGAVFYVYKFRTMVDGAERHTGATLAEDDDPRVTRVGRWLRSLRLDELPQLWNVVLGQMSLVGPRPERPEFVAHYVEQHAYYALRLRVKPGLTGLAQLYGTYGLSVDEKLKYDLHYMVHYSPALDFLLLLRTLSMPLQPGKARKRRAKVPSRVSQTSKHYMDL